MEKKYKFTEETRQYKGRLLHRIVALRDFSSIIAGTKGGWIEKEDNLSHKGDCWVSDNAIVCDKACVYDNAKVAGEAIVEGCGIVCDDSCVSVKARITQHAAIIGEVRVFGEALISGKANVCGNSMVGLKAIVDGNAYISGRVRITRKAHVTGRAYVRDDALIEGRAVVDGGYIYGQTIIEGNARVTGRAVIDGKAQICGNAVIATEEDFIVFKNWWSSGRYFTWTRSNDKYKVGCFYGTGKELIEAAYNDSEGKGREYERIVNYVNSIKNNGK